MTLKKDQKFHKWTVVHEVPSNNYNKKYLCICDCGNTGTPYAMNLKNGRSKDCGCGRKKSVGNINKKRGMANKSFLYSRWKDIKKRCYNSNHRQYKNYGGRGIAICKKWREDFEAFYDDLTYNLRSHTRPNR